MAICRFEINTVDRFGMTHDISSVFVKNGINIIWMEVYTHIIYVKIEKPDDYLYDILVTDLKNIEGVKSLREVDFISLEKKEIELRTIIDILAKGVIILDKSGKIKYANQYFWKDILKTNDTKMDSDLEHIFEKYKNKILSVLDAINKDNSSVSLEVEIKNVEYLIDISGIISENDVITGYLMIFQDSKKIKEIISSKLYDNQISFDDIIGESKSLENIIETAKIISKSDSSVLIMSESGTGKEMFARAIHEHSNRALMPFIAINCSAIPDQLMESELFGYEGGSFTGSTKNGKIGIFESANGGTIFLDEIGEMSQRLQAKLLRVLEGKKIKKIGSNKEIDIDVRIISATNRDLNFAIKNNEFRLDLFYRINIFTIVIPPLRERKEDILVLMDYFVRKFAKEYNKNIFKITEKAKQKLLNHKWSGNVRELENVVEKAIVLNKNGILTDSEIDLNREDYMNYYYEGSSLKENLSALEKNIIENSLKENKSIRASAIKLGVTHTLLINRMKKYKLKYDKE